jgi:hypothetical protein
MPMQVAIPAMVPVLPLLRPLTILSAASRAMPAVAPARQPATAVPCQLSSIPPAP